MGIATDGREFWVVDAGHDSVYRYGLTGAFLASYRWTPPTAMLEGSPSCLL